MMYPSTPVHSMLKLSALSRAIVAGIGSLTLYSGLALADNVVETRPYQDTAPFSPATLRPSQTDFGGVGLMQMPSGRVAPEGEFSFGVTSNNEYFHYIVSLQLMPWLETTIRYTLVQDMLYNSNYAYSEDTKYTDKGIDFKARLWEESYWLPDTSVGIRDLGGTGLFDGEFIAATKRFGNLDFTLGMGWGYMGQRGNITNPLCNYNDEYCYRDSGYKNNGGSIDYNRWFKGNSAIFGGIEYQTPYQPLRLKLEYDGNDYSGDFPVTNGKTDMTQHTPWNFGLLYKVQHWGDLRLSYERGDTLTFGFTFNTNFNDIKPVWRDNKEPEFTPKAHADNPDWEKVAKELGKNAGYGNTEILSNGENITVKGGQGKYRDKAVAHKRAALLLSQHRSDTIKTYTFVDTSHDIDVTATSYDADKFDQVAGNTYLGARLEDAKIDSSKVNHKDEQTIASNQSKLSYGIAPHLTQTIGSPETFYFYSIGLNANAKYRLTPSLEMTGSIYINLADNYDKYNYIEDSPHIDNFAVPRVRTLFRSYVHDNPVRMSRLQLTWMDQLSENVYAQTYGGYLEKMYAGVGGELLYRRQDANWAIGVDANLIRQRKTDSWFGLFSDEYWEFGNCNGTYTVSCAARVLNKGETGFLTAYYMPQWSLLENTLFKVGYGQFLGQDKGVRLDFSKQFDSGMIAGAYASKSDLSAEEFGEGSFTKGFYVSIPFDILTIKPSTSRANLYWQPLTRDGGQKLTRQYTLFGVTDGKSPWYKRKVP